MAEAQDYFFAVLDENLKRGMSAKEALIDATEDYANVFDLGKAVEKCPECNSWKWEQSKDFHGMQCGNEDCLYEDHF